MTSPRSRGRHKNKSRSSSPFVMVHWYVLDSQGWHDLSLIARCAHVELARKYDGANNGMIAMSARDLGKRLKRDHSTAAKALRELEDAGFIVTTKIGRFARKNRQASEYRLNAFISDIDSDPPDRKWNNSRWNSGTDTTVQWQNQALKDPPNRSRWNQRHCQSQNEVSHSGTSATHLESTRDSEIGDAAPSQPQASNATVELASVVVFPREKHPFSLDAKNFGPSDESNFDYPDLPDFLDRRQRSAA